MDSGTESEQLERPTNPNHVYLAIIIAALMAVGMVQIYDSNGQVKAPTTTVQSPTSPY